MISVKKDEINNNIFLSYYNAENEVKEKKILYRYHDTYVIGLSNLIISGNNFNQGFIFGLNYNLDKNYNFSKTDKHLTFGINLAYFPNMESREIGVFVSTSSIGSATSALGVDFDVEYYIHQYHAFSIEGIFNYRLKYFLDNGVKSMIPSSYSGGIKVNYSLGALNTDIKYYPKFLSSYDVDSLEISINYKF